MRSLTFISIPIKTIVLLTMFSLTPFLFNIVGVEATSQTVVKVDPPIIFARPGKTVTVNITVSNVQNLYGIEVTLYWDASILEMLNADIRLGVEDHPDGVLHNLSYAKIFIYSNEIFQGQGKYVLAASSTSPAPSFNGSGNIVIATFNVTGAGSCDLSLETKLASNIIPPGSTAVAEIPHTTINGFFGPIQIILFPKRVTVGENVNISGFIAPAQANVSVEILYRSEGETEWHTLAVVKTDGRGSYLYQWTPKKSGKFYVKSAALILGSKESSSVISVNVNEPEEPPWMYVGISVAIIIVVIGTLLRYRKRARK